MNPQCGEVVYTINPGHVCGTLPEHKHCTPSDCLKAAEAAHEGVAHCLVERGPERTVAVQVQKIEIRKHTFMVPPLEPVVGQVNHIEARGLIAIENAPTRRDKGVCTDADPLHRHVTVPADVYDIERGAEPGSQIECCILVNYYPITVHMDLPIGDGCLPFLGDNLIVNVRRAYGRLEHNYRIE